MYNLNEARDQIKDIPIEQIIGRYIKLDSKFKAICPFHDEKTPSFSLNRNKNFFKCFGCGKTGDAIEFVMLHKGLTYKEAIFEIAKHHGIQVSTKELTPAESEELKKREKFIQINQAAADWFSGQLKTNSQAKEYLQKRGWESDELKEVYQIGFVPNSNFELTKHLEEKGYTRNELFDVGLLVENDKKERYEVFRDRIIFPLRNEVNDVVGFIGRDITGKSTKKYLHTKLTPIFQKSEVIFNFNLAKAKIKETSKVFVVEGTGDVLRLNLNGIENVVAPMGTALTENHVQKLKKRGTKTICIIPDADNGGDQSINRYAELIISAGLTFNVLPLPKKDDGGKNDPDSFFTSKEQFEAYQKEHEKDYFDYFLEGIDIGNLSPREKSEIVNHVCSLLQYFSESQAIAYIDSFKKHRGISTELWTAGRKEAKRRKDENDKRGDKDIEDDYTRTIIERLESFIARRYDIRYNIISNKIEIKNKDGEEKNEHDVLREIRMKGMSCSIAFLQEILLSDFVPKYNPFHSYFENLPEWDRKTDFIGELAKKITLVNNSLESREWFEKMLKKMFLRTVACSCEIDFNKQAFVLVSPAHNTGKTSLLRWLVPKQLKDYYTETLTQDKDGEASLAQNFIINIDELAGLTKYDMSSLKRQLSTDTIKLRLPYGRTPLMFKRRCSFVGSSNQLEFLTDPTGNVRWICIEIERIDFSYSKEISIDDVWSQAYSLFKDGEEYQLTKEEVKANEIVNQNFIVRTPEMQLVMTYFHPADQNTRGSEFLQPVIIADRILKKSNVKISEQKVGSALTQLGYQQETKRSNNSKGIKMPIKGYWVLEKGEMELVSDQKNRTEEVEIKNEDNLTF